MYLKPCLLLLFSCSLVITNAQTFSARVLDTKTKEPIPYATVATGLNQGLITNEDGEFTFLLENVSHPQDSIFISYMGYETKGVLFSKTENLEILMTPKTYELNEVFLSTRTLDVDDIIDNVKERLEQKLWGRFNKKENIFSSIRNGNDEKIRFWI